MLYLICYRTSDDATLNQSASQIDFCNETEIKTLKGNFDIYKKLTEEEKKQLLEEN